MKEPGLDVSLIKGDKGVFDVRADGDLIYSKKSCGNRFPSAEEILAVIRQRRV